MAARNKRKYDGDDDVFIHAFFSCTSDVRRSLRFCRIVLDSNSMVLASTSAANSVDHSTRHSDSACSQRVRAHTLRQDECDLPLVSVMRNRRIDEICAVLSVSWLAPTVSHVILLQGHARDVSHAGAVFFGCTHRNWSLWTEMSAHCARTGAT